MNNVVKYGLGGLVVVVGGFVAVVAMQPAQVHVERSIAVAATPTDVFPYANDYKLFMDWNPWNELDPNQTVTFSDNPAGVGAWYAWKGNQDVGSGKMTITAVEPDQKVVSDLEFIEPFASKAVVTLAMAPEGDGTKVTWGFDSENDFMGKAAGLFMDMDAMLGKDFDRGLGKLKTAAEKAAGERIAREKAEAEAAAAAEAVATDAPADGVTASTPQ